MALLAARALAQSADVPALRATRERPLFAPTRRPPAPVADDLPASPPPAAAAAVVAPQLEVSGVIVGDGVRTALVRDPHGSSILHLTVGSRVDGWTVTAIRPRDIVLQRDARSVTIAMPEAGR